MPRDQIYSSQPSDELFQKLIEVFGIIELNTDQTFSRNDLQSKDAIAKLSILIPYLKNCYLPCKARTYLNDLNYKNIITILRHALKTRGYTVLSKERYSKGTKYIYYRLVPFQTKSVKKTNVPIEIKKKKLEDIVITFN